MAELPTYRIHAVRYARHDWRQRHQNFLMATDPHEAGPIDFFVWAVVGDRRTVVVDTGFDHVEAERRGRTVLRTPAEGLAAVGVDAARVDDVVLTHLHYDHAGTTGDFPAARFHLQEREMAYATGRHMTEPAMGHAYSAELVCDAVHLVYSDRVVFHDGDVDLAPGISLHLVGGHTAGLMVVRVHTERGWVVLASDSSHLYENFLHRSPFPIVMDTGAMVAGYDRLAELASGIDHIVPGHDPLVLDLYPLSVDGFDDAVRVDLPPSRTVG